MKQPIFYPGKQLCASDLIKLEEYAFSRTNIISPDCGVVLLFNNTIPQSLLINGKNNFILSEVYGITPSGRPIAFKAEGGRKALKLEYNCNGKVLFWDIYLDDIHPEANYDELTSGDEKYSLSFRSLNDHEEKPIIKNDNLYLGRYKLTDGLPPQIDLYPLVYSLASFNFPSHNWQMWTFPIREALREVARKNAENTDIVFFIKQILYNYPFWPLSQLFRACYQLRWLCDTGILTDPLDSLEEGAMQNLLEQQRVNPLPEKLLNLNPHNIPEEISILLSGGGPPNFKRISDKAFEIINNELIIKLNLRGSNEIKFKFKTRIQEDVSLSINNIYDLQAQVFEEKDYDDTSCYCFLVPIEMPESQLENQNLLKIYLPGSWKRELFTLHYRTIYEIK